MSKKKIVHIVPQFGQGGVQTAMLYSMDDLNKVFDYKILVITEVHEDWIEHLPAHQKDCIIRTGASNQFTGWIKAYRLLKKMKPDVVICSLWKSIIPSVMYKFFNRKTLLLGFFHTSYSPHLTYILLHKIMAAFQDACLADSDVTRNYVSNYYKIKKIYTIPFIFPFPPKQHSRVFDPENIRLAYFGIISPLKNIDRSLAFCKLCKSNGVNFIFDLYTFGAVDLYNNKIEQLGLKDEVTIYKTLPLSLVLKTMRSYDFLLQLSNQEGMAVSVVEAMNCGLVPIVTPVGEIAKYSKDGVNAIWLDPEFDAHLPQLFEKLKNILVNPSKYYELSSNSEHAFIHYKKYSEAFIDAIQNELVNK